jgi:nucleosome binding factor SPN SPT16 subunit
MIQPSAEQLQVYALVEYVIELLPKLLTPGATFGDIYQIAKAKIRLVRPDLVSRLEKHMGHLTGLEAFDSLAYIEEGSNRKVQPGSTFLICAGFVFNEVDAGQGRPWGVCLGQTVLVCATGPAQVLTSAIKSKIYDAVYRFEDDAQKAKDPKGHFKAVNGLKVRALTN